MTAPRPESTTSAIAGELQWPLDPIGWRGPCPVCRDAAAFLWRERVGRPRDSWHCTRCPAGGSAFALHRAARLHRRAAA
jgi:hypothetical protein